MRNRARARLPAALAALIVLVVRCTAPEPESRAPRPVPNLVIILADDLGYGDVGAYGSDVIATPHIDELAAGGVRLTAGYVSHPTCSPSRAGLMTGRYQQRHGWEFNTTGIDRRIGMSLEERTLADHLREAGYATGLVGKWHLGQPEPYQPRQRGFDEFFGVLEGGSVYIAPNEPSVEYASLAGEAAPVSGPNNVRRGAEPVKVDGYLTDVFTDEALAFVDRHRAEPFFLFLSHTTPHTPLQATKKYTDRYRHIEDDRARVYAAMVAALDDSVGAIVSRLRELQLLDDTLIVFLSDNGCASYVRGGCSNGPLRGYKRYHHEGGIRIPWIVHWPAGLPRGEVYRHPAIALDLLATFLAAARREDEARTLTEDSVNLLPYLRGERPEAPHDYLYWRSGSTVAIRDDRFKLIRLDRSDLPLSSVQNETHSLPARDWQATSALGQVTLLYDLQSDLGETRNIAAEHPEVVSRLQGALDEWVAGLVEPLFGPRRSTLAEVDGEVVQLYY